MKVGPAAETLHVLLWQRTELGKSKCSTYDIPNEGFVFGRPNIHDGEGASEGECSLWHQRALKNNAICGAIPHREAAGL